MSTGLWVEKGVPHRGWHCVSVKDLGEPMHTCEMCQEQIVRYVHTMVHDDYEQLDVGCICAGYMEQGYKRPRNYLSPKKREAKLKSRAARRAKWLTRVWRTTANDNERVSQNGMVFVIARARGGPRNYRASFLDLDKEWCELTRNGNTAWYQTANEAKLALFDTLWPANIDPTEDDGEAP